MARVRSGERRRTRARRERRREARRAFARARRGPTGGSVAKVEVGTLTARDVEGVVERLAAFVAPYRALMGWKPRQGHLTTFLQGLLSDLERKSVEPIAVAQGFERDCLQHFIGVSRWDDKPLLARLRAEVASDMGDPEGVLVVDGSGVPKSGTESVGVARQWCGRLGKVENCQVGVYVAYAGQGACTLIDRRLYLPRPWAADSARRTKGHVPEDVAFKTGWQLALAMVRACRKTMPVKWVVGDDEFGRPTRFRDGVAAMGLRYLMEVPSNVVVRKVRRRGAGRPPTWHRLPACVQRIPVRDWARFTLRNGDKGPIEVRAAIRRVETRRRTATRPETLLVVEALDGSRRWYFVTNAPLRTGVATLVDVAAKRNLIEQAFSLGKGAVGLDHYEVRTWQGWHHHTACALIAQWFLVREQRRLGKKSTPPDGTDGALHRQRDAAPATHSFRHRAPLPLPTPPQRGRPNRPMEGQGARSPA